MKIAINLHQLIALGPYMIKNILRNSQNKRKKVNHALKKSLQK